MRAVVVGAGIAGLSAAFRLQQAGFEVRVLEAADRVGGRMWTVERDGYRIDTGALVISARYTRLLALVRDAGLSADLVPTSDTIGFLRDGAVHRIRSTRPLSALRGGLFRAGDVVGLSRLALDLVMSWRRLDIADLRRAVPLDDENLADYARRRRLSPAVIDHVVEPLAMSLSFEPAAAMSKVGFLWALRRVFGGGFLNSPKGMSFLPAGLARQLDVTLNARVDEMVETDTGVRITWDGGTEEADAAVLAVPSPALSGLYPQLGSERLRLVERLRYAGSMHVHFGLGARTTETSAMVYSNPADHGGLGVTFFEHNKAPGRAPDGKGLLTAYFLQNWANRHWDLDDDKVVEAAAREVAQAYPGILDSVDMTFVTRTRECVVLNDPGLCREQAHFEAACDPAARIQLAGDYFSCSSTDTSLSLGERAARRIVASTGGRS